MHHHPPITLTTSTRRFFHFLRRSVRRGLICYWTIRIQLPFFGSRSTMAVVGPTSLFYRSLSRHLAPDVQSSQRHFLDNNSSIVLRSYQPRAMYQLLQRKQTEFLRISRKDVGERSPQTTMVVSAGRMQPILKLIIRYLKYVQIYNRYRPPSYYRHADKGAGRKSSLYHHNCTDHPRLPTFKTLVFQMTSDESIYSCFQNLRPSFPIFLCIASESAVHDGRFSNHYGVT